MRIGLLLFLVAGAVCHAQLFKNQRNENPKNMKITCTGCLAYSMHMGKMPPKLADLVPKFVQDVKFTKWTNPTTGKAKEFLFCSTLKPRTNGILLAAPESVDGERLTGWGDGAVRVIKEKAFLAQAKKQGWKAVIIPETFTGKPETQKTVDALVAKLGAESFKDRKAAKKDLIKLGVGIHPLLKAHLKIDDPEVKESLKQIMNALLE